MKYPGFIGVSDKTQSVTANPEETINWYYESQPQHAKNTAALYPTPGFSVWVASGASIAQGRALFSENGRTFGVMGKDYGELTVSTTGVNTFTRYGFVSYDTNQAQIVTNGSNANQAFVASGTNGYLHDLATNTLTQELTGDCGMVGMLDGYFAVLDPLTSTMRISGLNDGTTWDPLQFVSRSSAPDNWVAMAIVAPDIWLIGSKTGDIWYDAGTFPFPFAPRTGLSYKYGIVAPFTLKASGASLFWLSRNDDGGGIVVRTRGYSPTPVSDAAVETAIASYERDFTITDAEAFVYQEEGHTFYILHFPTAKVTWAYDIEENKWAKRSYWNPRTMMDEPWRARVHTYAFGKHLTADFTTANICTMSITIGTEADGSAIRRTRIAPGIFDQKQQIPIRNMEIYLQSGLGVKEGAASDATVLGSDPQVMFTTSDDGGNTWGNERSISAGKIGQFKRRLRMWRMGVPRDRVNKMVVTDPIPWRIIDAFINNDGL
jgi:hypothetical protein